MTSFLPKVECCFARRGLRARKAHVIWRTLGSCHWSGRREGTPPVDRRDCACRDGSCAELSLAALGPSPWPPTGSSAPPFQRRHPAKISRLARHTSCRQLVASRRSASGPVALDYNITPHMQNRGLVSDLCSIAIAYRLIGIRCLTRRFNSDGATTKQHCCAAPHTMGCQPVRVAV